MHDEDVNEEDLVDAPDASIWGHLPATSWA
jgi:hypothetical protein